MMRKGPEHPDAGKLRRAYARRLLAINGIADNPTLLRAFSIVPREKFLGPPPWSMLGYEWHATRVGPDDLDKVYRDVLFVLDAEKGINNGEPSLHARLIDALAPRPGDKVVHIGAGTGYYSAILAELVGPSGHVQAIEYDARLGAMAQENLTTHANAEVVVGDGAGYPRAATDCVYVNFAVAAPAARWIDQLAPGGRLIFPLGVPSGGGHGPRYSRWGAMFLVERRGEAFAAEFLSSVAFVFAVAGAGHADAGLIRRLEHAFSSRHVSAVRSLVWHKPAEPKRCWFHSEDWSLCYDPPGEATRPFVG